MCINKYIESDLIDYDDVIMKSSVLSQLNDFFILYHLYSTERTHYNNILIV